MPTPSHTTVSTPPSTLPHEHNSRPSCPPEIRRHHGTRIAVGRALVEDTGALPNDNIVNDQNENINHLTASSAAEEHQQREGEEPSPASHSDGGSSPDQLLHSPLKGAESDDHGIIRDTPSPSSTVDNAVEHDHRMSQSAHSQSHPAPQSLVLLNSPYASQRVGSSIDYRIEYFRTYTYTNSHYSFYPTHPHPFYALGAGFGVRNSRIVRFTKSKSISSMSI